MYAFYVVFDVLTRHYIWTVFALFVILTTALISYYFGKKGT
jgi:hypothetical protein